MIYIIGCGGVGSWLVPAIARMCSPENITLIDGDKLEEKNLDRQLFAEEDIGEYKSSALAEKFGCHSDSSWFDSTLLQLMPNDWLLCCVDNNPARREVLRACDRYTCPTIVGANEKFSSEAYIYHPEWKDHELLDPRIKYAPEIETDNSGNPEARGIGCTGEAQQETPQLVTANMMAAALMGHLFMLWHMELPEIRPASRCHLPIRIHQNLTRNSVVVRGEFTPKE